MSRTDDGATPEEPKKSGECMGIYKHYWQWVWENGQMTDRTRCTTCGLEEVPKRLKEIAERNALGAQQ